jgi:RNA polymerase sigma-70 factor, ECF subfamily
MTDIGAEAAAQRFTALFRQSHVRVLAYAARRTDRDRAGDIVAEVFATAWTNLDKIPQADPLPWLYRTAWHAIGNDRRAQSRQARLSDRLVDDASTDPDGRDPAEQVATAEQVLCALRTLNTTDCEVVRLLCWEQLSVAQAAEVLECSEGAVKVRLHRARRKLALSFRSGETIASGLLSSTKEGR